MANFNNLKRLIKEDFSKEYQDLIDKISYSYNPLLDQLSNAFNKNINIDNLSREFVTIAVLNISGDQSYMVNGVSTSGVLNFPVVNGIFTGGDLSPSVQIKTKLTAKVTGINIVRADNITNPATYPINAPWVSWSAEGKIITIRKVTGIQDGDKYNLVLELIS